MLGVRGVIVRGREHSFVMSKKSVAHVPMNIFLAHVTKFVNKS